MMGITRDSPLRDIVRQHLSSDEFLNCSRALLGNLTLVSRDIPSAVRELLDISADLYMAVGVAVLRSLSSWSQTALYRLDNL